MIKRRAKRVQLEANSVDALLKLTRDVQSEWNFQQDDVGLPWYRGQQRKHWKLLPNIVRQRCSDEEIEDEIREEFVVRAPALS
jgi:hypothetical protein